MAFSTQKPQVTVVNNTEDRIMGKVMRIISPDSTEGRAKVTSSLWTRY